MRFSQTYSLWINKKWTIDWKKSPFGLGGLKRKSLQIDDRKFWDLERKEKTLQIVDFSSLSLVLEAMVEVFILFMVYFTYQKFREKLIFFEKIAITNYLVFMNILKKSDFF